MKIYEFVSVMFMPFQILRYRYVRSELKKIIKSNKSKCNVLDVGGRKSPYTVGLPIDVTITELARETTIQNNLNLGMNNQLLAWLDKNRSNVSEVIIDDMTKTKLLEETFDVVLAVEVLEHVEKDLDFLHNVNKVLKLGGYFLMTTPNGDHVKKTNPDHKRHYLKIDLYTKLNEEFSEIVFIKYIVPDTKHYKLGLRTKNIKKPILTSRIMFSNLINKFESKLSYYKDSKHRTNNLFLGFNS